MTLKNSIGDIGYKRDRQIVLSRLSSVPCQMEEKRVGWLGTLSVEEIRKKNSVQSC